MTDSKDIKVKAYILLLCFLGSKIISRACYEVQLVTAKSLAEIGKCPFNSGCSTANCLGFLLYSFQHH